MYKFTIEYYFERYHTGALNYSSTRTGVVLASNRDEALKKIREVDNNYIGSAHITFEEVEGGAE
jgi:hypothetical protein